MHFKSQFELGVWGPQGPRSQNRITHARCILSFTWVLNVTFNILWLLSVIQTVIIITFCRFCPQLYSYGVYHLNIGYTDSCIMYESLMCSILLNIVNSHMKLMSQVTLLVTHIFYSTLKCVFAKCRFLIKSGYPLWQTFNSWLDLCSLGGRKDLIEYLNFYAILTSF